MEMVFIIIVEIARWLIEDVPEKIRDFPTWLHKTKNRRKVRNELIYWAAILVLIFLCVLIFDR